MPHPFPKPRITQPYKKPNPRYARGYHTGIDYGCRTGTKVRAVGAGKVIKTFEDNSYGNVVIVRSRVNKKFIQTWYCHLSKFNVKKGEKVEEGQVIALSGNTGNSTAPHLHLETRAFPFRYGNDIKSPFIDDPKAYWP